MYILKCNDGSYYIGSTKNLHLRLQQHYEGKGAIYTAKRLPVKLVYFEVFEHVSLAFKREHQLKKWSRKKKEALIGNEFDALHKLAECQNDTHYKNFEG